MQKILQLNDCLGLNPIDKNYYLVGDEPFKVYQDVYGKPATQSQIDQLVQGKTLANGKSFIDSTYQDARDFLSGQKSFSDAQTNLAASADPNNIIGNAQRLNQFYQTANQPVVSALQGQQSKLDDTYQKLLSSIKGQGEVLSNQQTLATNNELAKRGINSQSGYGAQQMINAQLPINAQINSSLVGAEQGYNQNALDLAYKLAQAQSGNPEGALSGATNFANIGVNANNSLLSLAQDLYKRNNPTAAESAQTNYYNALASGKLQQTNSDPLGLL